MEKKGIITSRTCPRCGHHEIGFTSRDGVFYPLKPGTVIQVVEEAGETKVKEGLHMDPGMLRDVYPPAGPAYAGALAHSEGIIEIPQRPQQGEEGAFQYEIWVPSPLVGDRRLRLKYGVWVRSGGNSEEMTPDLYQAAYLQKLQRLIEKEIYVPVAVILDRFFTAPHLASGTSKEIAEAMWKELVEIQAPALLVTEWLNDRTDETLEGLIRPLPKEELENSPIDEAFAVEEFEALSLEDFLEML